jgi:hypothetical protein
MYSDWHAQTIFRATDQWFASVQNFRDAAMNAIDQVQWVPSVGRNRIAAMVVARSDWCISRQRCATMDGCKHVLTNKEMQIMGSPYSSVL